jgi:hypothetical protein
MEKRRNPPLPNAEDKRLSAPRPPRPWPVLPRPKGSNLSDKQWDEMMHKVDVVWDSGHGPLFAAIIDLIFQHRSPAEGDSRGSAERRAEMEDEGSC